MYCKKCGAKVCCQDKYCSNCGNKITPALRELRNAEAAALREIKKLPEVKQLPCGHMLAEFCWVMARERYHPSHIKYTIETTSIPQSAFDEIEVAKEKATELLRTLARCAETYFAFSEGFSYIKNV